MRITRTSSKLATGAIYSSDVPRGRDAASIPQAIYFVATAHKEGKLFRFATTLKC